MTHKFEFKDLVLRNLKAPASGFTEYTDTKIGGFGLRVLKSDTKSFFYRYFYADSCRRLNLGRFPDVSLAAARAKAEEARVMLRQNRDPSLRIGKAALAPPSLPDAPNSGSPGESIPFNVAFEKFSVALTGTIAESTRKERVRDIRKVFLPVFGNKPVSLITRAEIDDILQNIKLRGHPSAANHALAHIRTFFGWCKNAKGWIKESPAHGIPRPARPNRRDRTLTADEIRFVWNAAEEEFYPLGHIIQLALLTAQRRQEVAGMMWEELDFENGVWHLPASRTKNGRPNDVPLSNFAIEILHKVIPVALPPIPDAPLRASPYVFPRPRNPEEPMKYFSKRKASIQARSNVKNWTIHDMRRTTATKIAEMGVDAKIRKKILNHVENSVSDIYERYNYFQERCKVLHEWAETVRKIVSGELKTMPMLTKNPYLSMPPPPNDPRAQST